MPAEQTRARSGPGSSAWSTAVWICVVSVTSTGTNIPPISLAIASPFSAFRSATTTRAPWAASARTHAAPMPDAPPVTTADAPSKSMAGPYDRLQRGRPPGHEHRGTGEVDVPPRAPGHREHAAGHVDPVHSLPARDGRIGAVGDGRRHHDGTGPCAARPGLSRAALVHPH